MSVKGVNEPQRRQKQVIIDPHQARDKGVIAYFQQAVQPKDRLPESKCPNCPKSEKIIWMAVPNPQILGVGVKKKIIRP